MRQLVTALLIALTAATTVAFGAILGETFILYPNIFHDPPESLARAREFLVAGSPSDFFPPLGMAILGTGAATVLLTWRYPRIRWYVLGAAAAYLCFELIFSVVWFWPRNEIMFVDPVGTHSAEFLRQTAREFVAGHWVRVAGSGLTSALMFTALVRWLREPARPS
ncbi:uncharacterized protein DUF1772 [Prauserella shujinwangii]|uniref:Uncharacterized protein DUF1772 n=1 Tax=Prauserella shujinwangii TaxID=1453103 RepID=A0A2T0M2J7_9PSEU|nr:DUF1772 domain-containing protein [Prauserella shujinwangii]PRX50942.1 uncharacterized protein DUF1772 [Prauserella shujinwangii]